MYFLLFCLNYSAFPIRGRYKEQCKALKSYLFSFLMALHIFAAIRARNLLNSTANRTFYGFFVLQSQCTQCSEYASFFAVFHLLFFLTSSFGLLLLLLRAALFKCVHKWLCLYTEFSNNDRLRWKGRGTIHRLRHLKKDCKADNQSVRSRKKTNRMNWWIGIVTGVLNQVFLKFMIQSGCLGAGRRRQLHKFNSVPS